MEEVNENESIPWNVVVKSGKPNKASTNKRRIEHKNKKMKAINVIEEDGADVANVDVPLWEKLELVVDSGAAETICPATLAKGVETTPGIKFTQGVKYTCANGKKLPNLGEKKMIMSVDDTGMEHRITMQVADVSRPLMSVSRAVDSGNKVVFDDKWSYIENKRTGLRTTIQRRGGLYVLESWVRPTDDQECQPFQRPSTR